MSTRDEIRKLVLADSNFKREVISLPFLGATIELKQFTTGDFINQMRNTERLNLVNILIDHAYVPGTEERVFSMDDEVLLQQLPYNADVQRIADAINKLMSITVDEAKKN